MKQFIELIEDFESSNSTKRKTNQFLQAFVETKSGKLLKDILLKDSKIKSWIQIFIKIKYYKRVIIIITCYIFIDHNTSVNIYYYFKTFLKTLV